MTDQPAPPRDAQQRRDDTLRLLAAEVDCWVATAGPGGSPWMVPLSFLWHDGELVLATNASSPTARNWAGGAPVRIGLGQVRDVVLVEGTVRLVPAAEVDRDLGDAFAAKSGFDPRVLRTPYVYAFVRPTLVQAGARRTSSPTATCCATATGSEDPARRERARGARGGHRCGTRGR